MKATVSEIHAYQGELARPANFVEPLFWGIEKKREVMEHFLTATWLQRASDMYRAGCSGEAAHARRESARLERREDGSLVLERGCGRRHGRRREKRVREVLGSWRVLRGWWEPSGGEDLVLYRLLLTDGAVVDVARRPTGVAGGDWELVGVVD